MNGRYIYLKQRYSIEFDCLPDAMVINRSFQKSVLRTSQLFDKYLNGFLPH